MSPGNLWKNTVPISGECIKSKWCVYQDRLLCSFSHSSDVIMSAMTSQITGVSIVYSNVCSSADQRRHQSSASLAFVGAIRRWPVNSESPPHPNTHAHKGPVTRTMFPFDDLIMTWISLTRNVFHLHQHSRDAGIVLWEQKPWHKIPLLAKCYDRSDKHFTDTLRTVLPADNKLYCFALNSDWFILERLNPSIIQIRKLYIFSHDLYYDKTLQSHFSMTGSYLCKPSTLVAPYLA